MEGKGLFSLNQEYIISLLIIALVFIITLFLIMIIYYNKKCRKIEENRRMNEKSIALLQKANAAKKDFLSHMSHELKTPLHSISVMTQMASKALDDRATIEDCLNNIRSASNTLLNLINNILVISKLDHDGLVLNNSPFSLMRTIRDLSDFLRIQIDRKQQIFQLDISKIGNDNLLGDSLRLSQILMNCISNSIKFTPQGGSIRLEVIEQDRNEDHSSYRFIITDNGRGMSEDFQKKLFLPFQQENHTDNVDGTGLGLSIVNNLVSLMGGTIHVESEINQGTTITIDIPFPIHKLNIKEPISELDCSGKRILIIEDNPINLTITCEGLKSLGAFVEASENGYEAIKLFEASDPGYYDAVLLDLNMPAIDGYETAKAIRNSSHADARRICIIIMTADDFSDNQRSMDCGMNYKIIKPIDFHYFCSSLIHIKPQ